LNILKWHTFVIGWPTITRSSLPLENLNSGFTSCFGCRA